MGAYAQVKGVSAQATAGPPSATDGACSAPVVRASRAVHANTGGTSVGNLSIVRHTPTGGTPAALTTVLHPHADTGGTSVGNPANRQDARSRFHKIPP